MPLIQIEVNDCSECPYFSRTFGHGAVCTGFSPELKDAVHSMVMADVYDQYQEDYINSSTWHVPEWCPNLLA